MNPRLSPLIFIALAALAPSAQADDFLFSITPNASDSGSPITGEIDGVTSSGSAPTAIYIFTQPTGYNFAANPTDNLLTDGYQFLPDADSITSVGGTVTQADIGIFKNIGTQGDLQGYGFNVSFDGVNNANGIYQTIGNTGGNGGTVTAAYNLNGITAPGAIPSGVVFTIVPEPRQTALIFLWAGVILLVGRKLYSRVRSNNSRANS